MNVYPSTEELLPDILLTRIPASLADEIRTRYATLSEKYLTERLTEDGRRINSCMEKSSVQDAIEEVVDAVFNTLVWIFKHKVNTENQGYLDSAMHVFAGLTEIYSLLAVERERELHAPVG